MARIFKQVTDRLPPDFYDKIIGPIIFKRKSPKPTTPPYNYKHLRLPCKKSEDTPIAEVSRVRSICSGKRTAASLYLGLILVVCIVFKVTIVPVNEKSQMLSFDRVGSSKMILNLSSKGNNSDEFQGFMLLSWPEAQIETHSRNGTEIRIKSRSHFKEERKKVRQQPASASRKTVAEGDLQKDHSSETNSKEQEENWQKSDQNAAANLSGKQAGKVVKESSQGEEDSKQNYIHVRARRGQATNSHSLAERVKREKISERMRLLQELVPGYNKITGKAVMLDEIINYVQSLQQQVEFLSMKLATVNPELNFDLERLLSKEMLNSRGGGPPILGFDQGMSSAHGFTQGIHQTMINMPNAASQYHHMSQPVWDGDLQSLLQMGFDSYYAA